MYIYIYTFCVFIHMNSTDPGHMPVPQAFPPMFWPWHSLESFSGMRINWRNSQGPTECVPALGRPSCQWSLEDSCINDSKTCSLQMLARRMMVCREECLWKPRNYEITSSLTNVVFGHMVLWLIDWFQQSTRCKECHKTPLGALVLAMSLELTREAKMHCFDTTRHDDNFPCHGLQGKGFSKARL